MNINEFRKQYQEYDGMSDFELGTTMHQKYYPDVPYEEFAQRFGSPLFDPQKYGTQEDDPGVLGAVKRVGQKAIPSLVEAGATASQWIAQGLHAFGRGDFLANSQGSEEALTAPVMQGLPGAAQYFSDKAQSARSEVEAINNDKPSHLQGRVWDNSELMKKPEWWIEGVGDAAVSLVPTLAAHVLSGGNSIVGGVVGGWMEGSSLYNELVKDGIDDSTAKLASSGYAIISATLNTLGLEKVFGKGAAKGVIRRLFTGAIAEGTTEYLEEPAQAVFESLARGEDVGQAQLRFVDSLKNVESGIFGGILGGGMSAVSRHKPKSEDTGPLIDDPNADGVDSVPPDTRAVEQGEVGTLTGPTTDVPNKNESTQDPFLADDGYAQAAQFVAEQESLAGLEQVPTETSLSSALGSGETVNLMEWGGTEEDPVFSQNDTILSPMAPPTEFAHPPVATPYTERPTLQQQSTQGIPQGQWAGDRSQLSYPYTPVQPAQPMQGMAFMGQGAQSQAVPTQAQLTNTQQAPRADTTAQAEGLGVPAPQAIPQEAQQSTPQKQGGTPQVAPAWGYALPSVAGAPYAKPGTEAVANAANAVVDDIDKMTRTQLMEQLTPEERKASRTKNKAALKEMVRSQKKNASGNVQTEAKTGQAEPKTEQNNENDDEIRIQFTSLFGNTEYPDLVVKEKRDSKAGTASENTEKKEQSERFIGVNKNGKRIFTDKNNVRSIEEEQGVRITQDVAVVPTHQGIQTRAESPEEMFKKGNTRFLTKEELEGLAEKGREDLSGEPEKPSSLENSEEQGAPDGEETVASSKKAQDLSEHFAEQLKQGSKYPSIVQARKEAAGIAGKRFVAGTTATKELEEAIELGVVKAARSIIAEMRSADASDIAIFRRLVELYRQQPKLSSRTSTSIAQQAYSTPAPLAFLASHLAGINEKTSVYEPTAGNGMLIMEASADKAIVNELNADRAERLRSLGFTVTEKDAATHDPGKAVDVVIANPPFGRVHDDGNDSVSWTVAGYETKELDHAIVLRALEALRPNGRAVIIIGGKQGSDAMRSNKYQAAMQRQFYRALFDNYNVVDHFTVDGKMYERQGAAYPVDFIVIDGKGRTEGRKFPAADLPRIYNNFEALEEIVNERRAEVHESVEPPRGRGADDSGVRGRAGDQGRGGSDGTTVPVDSAHDQVGGSGRLGIPARGGTGDGASTQQGRDVQPGSGRGTSGQGELSADRHSPDVRRQLPGTPDEPDGAAQRGISEQDSRRQGNTGLSVGHDAGRVGGTDEHTVSGKLVEKPTESKGANPKVKPQKATAHQEPYTPRSEATSMGTLVPRNMASPLKSALEKLEKKRGSIDDYVAKELGYSTKELKQYFAGEQIDAIGLAIDNISQGSGFIIGDQTGIGKGRVNAAIIRYARQKGLTPVFITMKPDLYADMIRDLNDIGEKDFNPLPTNAGLGGEKAIPLPDGRKLRTGEAKKHSVLLQKAAENGVADYDAVFTTYDQLNTVDSSETHRREFIRNIAPNALFILDESHNAGGSGSNDRKKKSDAPGRAEFIREVLATSSHGAFYSSATYAKRPDVMSLYFKTDMRHAVDDIGKLAEAVSAGGIPLQQVVAAQLTESGQYIRRERSFEGASVEVTHAEAKMEHAEQSATIMRTILAFDAVKQKSMEVIKKEAKGAGEDVGDSNATGEKGANSTNFTSIMHNLIGQSLLAMKAKAAADEAAAAVERGEKPVLTLANTMGSFIEEHVRENTVQAGEELSLSFKDLYRRYLLKTRTLTKKDSSGKKVIESRLLTDEELGADGVAAYNEAMQIIDGSVFDELPISPIDYITAELEKRGIRVGEITGRSHAVEYQDGVPHYRSRKTSSAKNIETMRQFNNGELDTMILNQSGSTGISLHSSSTFTDQRKRTMIIVQPELNIDVFMQTLGRVFRTGQVVPPSYKLLTSDIPAEKRPSAVLGKKMAGLNANTTASRTTDTTFQNIPDFLNEYGDIVTAQIMSEEQELHEALGSPLKATKGNGLDKEDAVRKVTGRIPMLPLKDQQALYERIETEYKDLIAQLEATGGAALEAKTLPLDATLIESFELTSAKEDTDTDSPFAAESRLGLYDVKVLGKPYTPDQVRGQIEKGKESAPDMESVRRKSVDWLKARLESIENEDTKASIEERTTMQFNTVSGIVRELPIGKPVLVNTVDAAFTGVVTRIEYKGKGNPSAPSAWRATVAVADAAKQITVPFSKIQTESTGEISVGGALIRGSKNLGVDDVMRMLESGQTAKREKRYIAFGNILAAYASVGSRGQVVNFENSDGSVRAGIMYKKDAAKDEILGTASVSFPDFDAVSAFFSATGGHGIVKSADGNLVMAASREGFKFTVPASKAKGAQFFLNGKLLEAAGKDFVKSGNSMSVTVGKDTAAGMVATLREQGFGLVAGSHRDEARTVMGMDGKDSAPMASRTDLRNAKPVRVVDVDPDVVPEFKKLGELVDWLKGYFDGRREETIASTGKTVSFTNTGLAASVKRSREQGHTDTYPALHDLVRKAEYEGFEPNDARHPHLAGQEIYFSAMRMGDKLYAVRMKFDVPSENELISRGRYPNTKNEDLRYKDHALREIEIAPVAENYGLQGHTATKAIHEVSLGVLRNAVNPTSIENGLLFSISPGQFLPLRNPGKGMHVAAVKRVTDALSGMARASAPVKVVQSFSDLPQHLREYFGDAAADIEGVYDPQDGVVYVVADNLSSPERAAEVWLHEQIVHHGLRSMLPGKERKRILNRLWASSGGMGNTDIAEIAKRYGLRPTLNEEDRAIVMEEYLASLAEKKQQGLLTPREKSMWRRFVEAIANAWNAIVRSAGGKSSMGAAEIDNLLTALGEHVMGGMPQRGFGDNDGALASRGAKPLQLTEDRPMASLVAKVTGLEKTMELLKNENVRVFFPNKTDLTLMNRVCMLPHWIAKKFPGFGVIYDRQLKRMDERNTDTMKSLQGVPSLFDDKHKIGGKDMDDLRRLIWDNEGKEIAELKDTAKFLDADILSNGRKLLKESPEWYAGYKSWLAKQPGSEKAKKAMLEVRRSLDNDLLRAHNRMAAMSEFSDSDITEFRTTINHQHNYFPHHRYGQYYVQARAGKTGKGDDKVLFRVHFDAANRDLAKAKAAKIIAEQKKKYPNASWFADENAKLPDEVFGVPMDTKAMEQIVMAATAGIADKEQAELVRTELKKSTADMLKSRGWGSHAIGRKGIPGHEEQDILRVLYDYKSGLSGWLTKMEAARDFSKGLGNIDAKTHPVEWSYAAQYVGDMLRNYDKIDRITGNIKSVAFAWYLGANFKTAALNLTQNVISGVPRLQMDVSGGVGYFRSAMDAIVKQVTGGKGTMTEDEAQLLRDLYDNALVTNGYMEEVRGRVSGVDGAAVWNRLLKVMGWPMAVAERFNRASLALAAYRAARSGRLKEKAQSAHGIDGKANYEQAKAYAESIVRDAHFEYGKANSPEFLRSSTAGRIISPAYTFRTFSHNLLSLWSWALRTQGKDGAKMVAKSLAATLAIGGVASAPFFATAMAIFQAAFGDDDDWIEKVRKWSTEYLGANEMMRDIITYGLPSVAGVNLGGSLKMETPFSQGLKKGSTPKDVLTESIGDIIGIPYDLFVQRPTKIMDAYKNRNYERMVEEAMPTAIQNGMRAWRLHTDGQKTMSGRDINDPGEKGARKLTEMEAIGKLLGFQPVSSTKAYDRYSATQRADKVRSDKAGEFAARMLRAREERKGAAEVRADMRRWNEEMIEDGKPWMVIRQKDVDRRMAARRRENKLSDRERPRKAAQSRIWE